MSESAASAPSAAPESSSAPVESSYAPVDGGEGPEGGELDYNDDGNQLLEEAIAMVNKGTGVPQAPPSPHEVRSDPPDAASGDKSPQNTTEESKENAPSAADWAKFYSQQKQLDAQRAEFEKNQAPLKEFLAAKESGDIAQQLKLLGYEDGVKFLELVAQNGAKMTPEARERAQLRQEIENLKRDKENERKQAEAAQTRARQQEAEKQVLTEVRKYLDSVPEESMAAIAGGEQAIYQKMRQHYRETKEKTGRAVELTPKQAADMVEKEWLEGLKVFAKNKKFRNVVTNMFNEEAGTPARPQSRPTGPKPPPSRPVPRPGEGDRDAASIYRGDKELEEALRLMNSRTRARQP